MQLLLVFSFVFFGLASFAHDSWRAQKSAKEIEPSYAANKISVQNGQSLYSSLCWACRGKNENGDNQVVNNLNPKPKDFSSTGRQKQIDRELFWKLSNSKEVIVPYKCSLNRERRWQLINCIKTFSLN